MTPGDIDGMCKEFSNLFLLWDGAFSLARKVDPTDEDIAMYQRFVDAAISSHVAAGCNITHKAHLMLEHVALQMRSVKGGLGNKLEDWVERQHQTGEKGSILEI